MINTIIVDDEPYCCQIMVTLLERYCPDVKTIAVCNNGEAALNAIIDSRPQLVFLDIEMPKMNGFELLERLANIDFELIFTTAYDQYAIKAIRFSALDYLLKPIDPKELVAAVDKAIVQKKSPSSEQLLMLMNQLRHIETGFTKIAVPTTEGYELIPASQIVRCEADSNYTHIYLNNKKTIIACRTLKEMAEQLEDFTSFFRVHHSSLVNLNEVIKYVRGDGGYLIMNDGTTVNVSRNRKELLLDKIKPNKGKK